MRPQMKLYRDLSENPLFERVDCPVCGNTDLRSTFTIAYGQLKQKPSLDYSSIGVGPETVFNVDECPDCRLVLANPRIKPEHQDLPYNESKQNQWENLDGEVGPSADKTALRSRRLRYVPVLQRLIALNGNTSELSLLDVGAGYGHTLALARELGIDGCGIEIDRARLAYCRKADLEVYEPDEFDSKFPDRKFDILVAQSILEHAADLNAFMRFVGSKAGDGAVLFINGLTPEVIRLERRANRFVRAHFVEHINFTPVKTMDFLMRRYGFRPINEHILLLDGRTFQVPEAAFRLAKALMRIKNRGIVSRYYRFVGTGV